MFRLMKKNKRYYLILYVNSVGFYLHYSFCNKPNLLVIVLEALLHLLIITEIYGDKNNRLKVLILFQNKIHSFLIKTKDKNIEF